MMASYFDKPSELLDSYVYGPYHKANTTDVTDTNISNFLDSGILNVPETKLLVVPKVILFFIAFASTLVLVYSLLHNKSSRLFVISTFLAHETLRVSYNLYLSNTLSLLAKNLIKEPEMAHDSIQSIIAARAQQNLSQDHAGIALEENILGGHKEKVAQEAVVKHCLKVLPLVILDQTIALTLSMKASQCFAPRVQKIN